MKENRFFKTKIHIYKSRWIQISSYNRFIIEAISTYILFETNKNSKILYNRELNLRCILNWENAFRSCIAYPSKILSFLFLFFAAFDLSTLGDKSSKGWIFNLTVRKFWALEKRERRLFGLRLGCESGRSALGVTWERPQSLPPVKSIFNRF